MGEHLVFPPYSSILPFSRPHVGNAAFVDRHHPLYPWGGHFTIDITSIPDQTLPQTWSWVLNVSGAGPTLSVPDDSSTFALLTASVIGLFVAVRLLRARTQNRDSQLFSKARFF